MKYFRWLALFLTVIFIVPTFVHSAVWFYKDRPGSWHAADWSSSGFLPSPTATACAQIYIFAARTGGLKGALAKHSWIVTKSKGANHYNRYDKVGWGRPIRQNAYAADAFWYSNPPELVQQVSCSRAEHLIPKVEQAIVDYNFSQRGDYKIWPGPNSNSFVAHVLDSVPELGAALPPTAVGRDFAKTEQWFKIDSQGANLQVNFRGLIGFALGSRHGFELQFLGLVAGFDVLRPALKLPGFGRINLI